MIALASVSARSGGGFRRAASVLDNVSLAWEHGVLAVLGTPADGTTALLDVLAGAITPRRGRVDVGAPGAPPPRVVHVRAEPTLPEGMRVAEIAALEASLRGAARPLASATERLAALGGAHLETRAAATLSRAEARAVQLALALTSKADVLLLEEPLAVLEAPAPARVASLLRELASTTCVVLTTSSVRDAASLGDRVLLLVQGKLREPAPGALHVGPDGGTIELVLRSAERAEETATALAWSECVTKADAEGASVHVSGREFLAVSEAVMRAVATLGLDVEAIETRVLPLDALRAAGGPR